MRKLVLSLVASVLFFTSPVFAEEFDVRNVRWGMTKDQVIKAEGREPTKEGLNALIYDDTILGYFCTVVYSFDNHTNLDGVIFGWNHDDQKERREIFNTLLSHFNEKYSKYRTGKNINNIPERLLEHTYSYQAPRSNISVTSFEENKAVLIRYFEGEHAKATRRVEIDKATREKDLSQF